MTIAHPTPSFYETTVVDSTDTEGNTVVITHREFEEIVARPKWNLAEAKARVEPAVRAAVKKKAAQRIKAQTAPAKKAPAKR